jgi:hypothetical protein
MEKALTSPNNRKVKIIRGHCKDQRNGQKSLALVSI